MKIKKLSLVEHLDFVCGLPKGVVWDGDFSKVKGVWGYCRVSTEEQKKGFSIENQKSAIDGFCNAKGLVLAGFFIDEGFSAKNPKRPNFRALFEVLKPGDLVIVLWWSRWYRDVLEKLYFSRVLSAEGIFVYATDSSNDPLVMKIESILDENEVERIAKRTKSVQENQFGKGKTMNRPPFGYYSVYKKTLDEKDKGKWKINRDDAKIILDIFNDFVSGTSVWNLAKRYGMHYKKIQIILNNKTYIGMICFDGVWLEQKSLKIIDQELFDKVQGLLK